MKEKETPWFRGKVKPVRVGVYKRAAPGRVIFSKWDGHCWLIGGDSVKEADKQTLWSIHQSYYPWRGLAEDPHESKS